jgi:NTE family protein
MTVEASSSAAGPWVGPFAELLDRIDPAARDEILAAMTTRRLDEGETLIEFMAPVAALHVVRNGLLCTELHDPQGSRVELGILGPGDFCGEMSLLRSEPATATVRAVSPVTITSIAHSDLVAIAGRYPSVIWQIASVVAKKLGRANERLSTPGACRAAIAVGINADWPARALALVAASCARHLARPVLVLAASPVPMDVPYATKVESLAALAARARSQPADAASLDLIEAGIDPAADGALAAALPDLRRHYGLVLVAAGGTDSQSVAQRLLPGSDVALLEFRSELEPPPTRPLSTLQRRQTVLLRRSLTPVLPSSLRSLGSPGDHVIAVIPGGLEALASRDHRPAETDRAIDWVARHTVGKKVGIAFGAGGSKGFAHLGMVAGLLAHGIPIDYSAGCSIGAPIAAAIADGMPVPDLKEALDRTFARALKFTIPYNSFLSTRSLRADFERIARGRTFQELRGPLALVAVDQITRSEVVLKEGSVATAMLASMAIPGIFPPVQIGDRSLVDGALLNPIPNTTVADLGADIVIGLRLSNAQGPVTASRKRSSPFRSPPILDTVLNAFEVMQAKIGADGVSRADLIISPEFRGPTGLRDFARGDEFIEFGREAVEAALPRLQEFFPWVN